MKCENNCSQNEFIEQEMDLNEQIIDGKTQLYLDLTLIQVLHKYYPYFKTFKESVVWEQVLNEMSKNGFNRFNEIMCKIRFNVLTDRYFYVIKSCNDCQTAIDRFPLFLKMNAIFIDYPSLYFTIDPHFQKYIFKN